MGDLHLMGAMYAIHKLKLKVPSDIAIISISNGLIPTLYDPKITFVETSGYKLGKLAFAQMISCFKRRDTQEEVIVEALLVEGGSL